MFGGLCWIYKFFITFICERIISNYTTGVHVGRRRVYYEYGSDILCLSFSKIIFDDMCIYKFSRIYSSGTVIFLIPKGENGTLFLFFFKNALKKLDLRRSFELNSRWEMNVHSLPCNRQTLLINGKATLMFALLIHQNGMKGRSIKREVRRNLCWKDPYLDVYCTYLYGYI